MPRAPLYMWKESAVGRRALCLILQYAEAKAGSKLLTSSPGDFGISGEALMKWVLERVPQLEVEHLARTGQPMTAKKMMSRLYNMFDVLPSGHRTPSSEHPTVNDSLRGLWREMQPESIPDSVAAAE